MTHASVTIQITPESKPSTPSWMGEVAAFAQVLTHEGILKTIVDQVRNARTLDAPSLTVTLYGLSATFAHSFGFDLLATA